MNYRKVLSCVFLTVPSPDRILGRLIAAAQKRSVRVRSLPGRAAAILCAWGLCAVPLNAQQAAGMDTGTVERCKAATALVRPDKGGRGSSFCIHGAGLFLASHHVVGSSDGVTLVLHSGSAAEKSVKGRVIRSDQQLDIVLIHAAELEGGYTAMPLGVATDLVERLELTAFGYPYPPGTFPSQKNPLVKADAGRITALKSEDGRIVRVETDAVVFGGNSGGAMVNGKGLVMGAVAAGKPGKPLSYAIPVNRIRDFLAGAAIVFEPPPILEREKSKPTDFECRVFLFDNTESTNLTVQLTLRSESGAATVIDLRATGKNAYRAKAAPCAAEMKAAPGQELSLKYRLVVMQGDRQVGLQEGAIPLVSFEHGLVSYLKFSEGEGNRAADSSGHGNHGTVAGNPKWIRDALDGVIEMNGIDNVIELPNAQGGSAGRGRSLVVRLRSAPGGEKGVWAGAGPARTMQDLLRQGVLPGWPEAWGNVVINMIGPMQNLQVKPIDDGAWHEVVFVCDPESNRAAMFVDGEPTVEGVVEQVSEQAPTIQIGRTRAGSGPGANFRGQIDAVGLYDRVLSKGEIRLLWQKAGAIAGKGGAPGGSNQ
ncbi:MAG: hypothetical protein C0404_03120 [Verrucomicrobia bacterium]|nr:hypothetical protein [Verrucomicrobiota bacterium]